MTYCIYVHMQIHIQYTYTYTCTCTRVNQVPLFECIWCTESISICEDGWSYSWGNWHNSSFYRLEDDSCFQWWLTHNEQEGTWVRLWRFRRPIAASPEIPSEPVDSTMYSKWLHSYKCAKTVVHPQNRSWSEYVMSFCLSLPFFASLQDVKLKIVSISTMYDICLEHAHWTLIGGVGISPTFPSLILWYKATTSCTRFLSGFMAFSLPGFVLSILAIIIWVSWSIWSRDRVRLVWNSQGNFRDFARPVLTPWNPWNLVHCPEASRGDEVNHRAAYSDCDTKLPENGDSPSSPSFHWFFAQSFEFLWV